MARKGRPPSFQFYPSEYLSSRAVAAMHPTARGGYVHLLCHAWLGDRPGWLPDDEGMLAALSGLGERWADHRDSIARAWVIRKGWWVQPRMVSERRAQKRRFSQASRGAKSTNATRWKPTTSIAQRPHSDSLSGRTAVAPLSFSSSSVESTSKTKDAAPPRLESQNGKSKDGPDVAMIAERIGPFGPAKVREVMQLAWGWWKSGIRRPDMVAGLVDAYVARRGSILNAHAYFNAGGDGFKRLYESVAAHNAEAEGERHKREAIGFLAGEREAVRARLEHEARNPVEEECP